MSFTASVGDDTLVREGSSQRWDLPAPLELSLSDSTRWDTSGGAVGERAAAALPRVTVCRACAERRSRDGRGLRARCLQGHRLRPLSCCSSRRDRPPGQSAVFRGRAELTHGKRGCSSLGEVAPKDSDLRWPRQPRGWPRRNRDSAEAGPTPDPAATAQDQRAGTRGEPRADLGPRSIRIVFIRPPND